MSYLKERVLVSKSVNVVYETSDLSIFKQISGNRPPNVRHIDSLAQSIEQNGLLQNPIIVNKNMDVIDGQHRLLAAQKVGSSIFYIICEEYTLKEVQLLNLNQKNWTKMDFIDGYADMGIESYAKLRDFITSNDDFNVGLCIAMCNNTVTTSTRYDGVIENGTWKGKSLTNAQYYADNIRKLNVLFPKYSAGKFVRTMLGLLIAGTFVMDEFITKLLQQPTALELCATTSQQLLLIEEIYNYRRRNKVNLRYS